ncbi:hypothetical protein D3218_12920 [Aureimonas flava]|uniref:Uncharacterized protein n=1 Tax=Aureimonas flava TaxID=2320271 RepID=A0A3A1WS80_9HYPH|nr:hypothetical protein [Aureimonas flava]RIY00185.1 hypothetical protein D3218_12920 [Aureimonas flava]
MRIPHPITDLPLDAVRLARFMVALTLLTALGLFTGYHLLAGLDAHLKAQSDLGQEAFRSVRTASMEQGR